jgi:hypothetical protein
MGIREKAWVCGAVSWVIFGGSWVVMAISWVFLGCQTQGLVFIFNHFLGLRAYFFIFFAPTSARRLEGGVPHRDRIARAGCFWGGVGVSC